MTADELFLARMRQDPAADPKRVARDAGVSSRAARRLVAQLQAEGTLSSRRKLRFVAGALLLTALGVGVYLLHDRGAAQAPAPPTPPSPEVKAKERELYAALDRRDPGRAASARLELSSRDDAIRLAALRYLATVSLADHATDLVALFDDPSERVRPVALQLVGEAPGPDVEAGLIRVLRRDDRPLAERLLAVSCLLRRRTSREAAVEVLPVLLDGSPALREQVANLLAQVTHEQVAVDLGDPKALHAAWRGVLGVSE